MTQQGTRRDLMRYAVEALSALTLLPFAARADTAKTCSNPSSESLRASLHYTDATPDSALACRKCSFLTLDANSACGNCAIMSDAVNPNGHCDSWAAQG